MFSFKESEAKLNKLKGRNYKLLADSSTIGCKNLNVGVSFFPPGTHAPGHVHENEEEVIYCLKGYGKVYIDGKSEPIEPGTVVYFPPGSLHSVKNESDQEIKLLFIFSPATKIGDYADYDGDDK
ncbi:MAG: cupin domain-containing protein [Actinobacteria bacterium]|nr:cupin domain-containing protein [Actinomycetota bacterium]